MQILRFKALIKKGVWRPRCVLKVTGKGNSRPECSRRWVCVLTPLKDQGSRPGEETTGSLGKGPRLVSHFCEDGRRTEPHLRNSQT